MSANFPVRNKNYYNCIYNQSQNVTVLKLFLSFLLCLIFISFYFYFRDASTIFRGNSLATRCLDEMMKIVGGHYLKVTLKPVLDEVRRMPHCQSLTI